MYVQHVLERGAQLAFVIRERVTQDSASNKLQSHFRQRGQYVNVCHTLG